MPAIAATGSLEIADNQVPSLDLVIVNRADPKLTSKRIDERKREQLVSSIEAAAGASVATK